ncbi:DNA polymerase III subunit delta [Marivita sp. XM-24bin2]|jgi:DNA polymerase-3 subunit delta|uniref:DNA polymerase III subunit delta n=1 Tax=unclassified Marivita TaxID=2632480 RepID=UPI000D79E3B7|nr:DNA polymerase III subunit delta [Marivita sp. XM-24bin2]MCR9107615.1 DNA polymerase III subunit delta [Paracoccaceae bacterium]PWL33733.1 MAG: DNA polymerase III subunit delta [Marivita sp. XM-24bin2]
MKLPPREASGYFARPDPAKLGILIYGEDAMRVALKRQELIAALIGPEGEAEMRLTRIPAAELRKESALLGDAIKAVGFFPGPRVAFVEDANDTVIKSITAAVEDWQPGDAQIVVTAGQLQAKSALRKLFEGHPNAYAAALYNDPPSRAEIEAELTRAGLARPDGAAMEMLTALSKELDPGDFRQTLEKIALYKLGDGAPLSPDEVTLCAPGSTEADLDDVLNIVAEGRTGEIGPVMARLEAQGTAAVTLLIMATRHFRALHTAASDPAGVGQGMGRLRPPVFGPRRDRMSRQASGWGMYRLEQALQMLLETDLSLRSAGQHGPALAIVERAFIRLAMLGRR